MLSTTHRSRDLKGRPPVVSISFVSEKQFALFWTLRYVYIYMYIIYCIGHNIFYNCFMQ